jgi:glycosyltransferase involved in cell wall biosynthesis
MKLTACLIVKNEAANLALTLPSLSAGVDELIVVDTGSTDETVQVAERFGAKVFHFPWIGDFAAARNESLKHATGDWIIWVDGDEFIKPEGWARLRTALANSPAETDAYFLPIGEADYGQTNEGNYYFRIKVFRNGRGYHFERRINEQLYTTAGAMLETRQSLPEAKIYHWGLSLSAPAMQNKIQRNISMLTAAVQKEPGDQLYHFLLANNYLKLQENDKALAEYAAAYEVAPRGPLADQALISRARVLMERREDAAAYAALKQAAELAPGNAEIYNLIGVIYMTIGNFPKAIEVLEHARRLPAPKVAGSAVDPVQYGYQPHFLLGNAYFLAGDKAKALAMFQAAYQFSANPELLARIEKLQQEKQ